MQRQSNLADSHRLLRRVGPLLAVIGAGVVVLGFALKAFSSSSGEDVAANATTLPAAPSEVALLATPTPGQSNLGLVDIAPGEEPDWDAIQAAAGLTFSPPGNLPAGFEVTGVRYPVDALTRPVAGRFVMIFIREEGGGTVLQVGPAENPEGEAGIQRVDISRSDVKVFSNGSGAYYLTGAPDGHGYFAGLPGGSTTTEDEIVAILLSVLP